MSVFKTADFVQVEHVVLLGLGEPTYIWRNALYNQKCPSTGGHTVTYADGTMEVLAEQVNIRMAPAAKEE